MCCARPGCSIRPAGISIAASALCFFALGYLGWFVGPIVLLLMTALVVVTMWRRQFTSDALHAVSIGAAASPPTGPRELR
jgi:uncharacterized membrane protein